MSDELGAGPALDQDLDFSVGTTGDLRHETGESELQKDLAFQMIISLDKYLGRAAENNLAEKVAATASRVALADVRVESVDRANVVVRFEDNRERLELILPVSTEDDEEQELVFNV